MMHFTHLPHPSPTPDAARDALIADPGFGTVFTDHMVVVRYDEAHGGSEPRPGAPCGEGFAGRKAAVRDRWHRVSRTWPVGPRARCW
jgi:hypothetical protein